jgi:hypothetical protein
LERQIDRLARVLRRSPHAVRRALEGQQAVQKQQDQTLTRVLALKEPLAFVEEFLRQAVKPG